MKVWHLLFSIVTSVISIAAFAGDAQSSKENKWISLFNGENLNGWTIKIAGQDLGVNYKNTFRAENGVLRVSYDQYKVFDNNFGHLFYKTPYSNYRLRFEYRFTGEQTQGAPEWAIRNAGVMYHAQSPQTMRKDQFFPVCVELQLLGGDGQNSRPTGNMCSPGSHISLNGEMTKEHCINSSSPTFHGDQWVTLDLEVKGDTATHFINGKPVFELSNPILDESDQDAKAMIDAGIPLAMRSGYIALQAEGHNVEYRNIELMPYGNK